MLGKWLTDTKLIQSELLRGNNVKIIQGQWIVLNNTFK